MNYDDSPFEIETSNYKSGFRPMSILTVVGLLLESGLNVFSYS